MRRTNTTTTPPSTFDAGMVPDAWDFQACVALRGTRMRKIDFALSLAYPAHVVITSPILIQK
jgi:hypothetical protein